MLNRNNSFLQIINLASYRFGALSFAHIIRQDHKANND